MTQINADLICNYQLNPRYQPSNIYCLIIFLVIILASSINAICCEKVKNGAYCVDVADASACDNSPGYNIDETACESTTYCTTGTNIDSEEGTCF